MQPRPTAFGQRIHPTLAAQAAAYIDQIANNHPFVDGNKRAALLAGEAFLLLNGHELALSDRDIDETILDIASGNQPKQDLITSTKTKYIRICKIDLIV